MDYHLHAEVTENSRFTDRRKCFTGTEGLVRSKVWLEMQVGKDWQISQEAPKEGSFEDAISAIQDWDGTTEVIETEVTVGGARKGYSVLMGYRIMHIDGACEEML